jgi:hypothetical protein
VTAGCEADTYFDHKLLCLLANNFQDVVTIHRSQEVKILSHYTDIPCTAEEVLQEYLKFTYEYFHLITLFGDCFYKPSATDCRNKLQK